MNDIRNRLVKALHTSATLPALREELVLMLCDMDAEQECSPTVRSIAPWITDANVRIDEAPETEPDSAPPTPVNSAAGQEFGV
jgi:hypothetical protein